MQRTTEHLAVVYICAMLCDDNGVAIRVAVVLGWLKWHPPPLTSRMDPNGPVLNSLASIASPLRAIVNQSSDGLMGRVVAAKECRY